MQKVFMFLMSLIMCVSMSFGQFEPPLVCHEPDFEEIDPNFSSWQDMGADPNGDVWTEFGGVAFQYLDLGLTGPVNPICSSQERDVYCIDFDIDCGNGGYMEVQPGNLKYYNIITSDYSVHNVLQCYYDGDLGDRYFSTFIDIEHPDIEKWAWGWFTFAQGEYYNSNINAYEYHNYMFISDQSLIGDPQPIAVQHTITGSSRSLHTRTKMPKRVIRAIVNSRIQTYNLAAEIADNNNDGIISPEEFAAALDSMQNCDED